MHMLSMAMSMPGDFASLMRDQGVPELHQTYAPGPFEEDADPWWKWWLAQFPLLLFPLGIVLLVAGFAAWLADPRGESWKVLFAMVGVCWAAGGFLSIALW